MTNRGNQNFKNQINRKTVNSILKDILQHSKIVYNERIDDNGDLKPEEIEVELKKEHFYFRGESSYHEFRTPSLYLQEKLTMEGSEYYYRVLLNELGRDDYQENTSLVRLMSELQHYGAKTRMLDITRNPLVALYFAVEKDDSEPGFLFVYKSNSIEEKFDTGHTVAIKSALNFMPQQAINNFLDGVNSINKKIDLSKFEYVQLEELGQKLKGSDLQEEELNGFINVTTRFMELLNQRARVRERLVYPFKIFFDLQKAHIVIPSKTTDRIRQQQGAFIYPRYVSSNSSYNSIKKQISDSINELSTMLKTNKVVKNNSVTETDTNTLSFSVIKIDGGNKRSIRNQLELLGITEGFIYPDIEHQSNALIKQINP